MSRTTTALTLAAIGTISLLSLTALAPTGLGQLGTDEQLLINPGQDVLQPAWGDTLRACIPDSATTNDTVLYYQFQPTEPLTQAWDADGDGTVSHTDLNRTVTLDTEDCAPIALNATHANVTEGDQWLGAGYNRTDLQENRFVWIALAIGDDPREDVTAGPDTATNSVQGFATFDTRVVEFLWFGLTVLALWHGWYVAAFVFLGATVATQTGWTEFGYTWGYIGGALALTIELLGHKFPPIRKLREAIAS